MRKVHADGRCLAQDGKDRIACKKLGTEAQRIVVRVAGTEHPLVATYAAHAAAHLVGERLEAERPVAGGQRTGDGGAGALFGLRGQKDLDGFLEAAFQQVLQSRRMG